MIKLRLVIPILMASTVFAQAMFVDSFTDGATNLETLFPSSPKVSSGPVDVAGSPFATREVSISYGIQRLVVDVIEGALQYELKRPADGQQGNSWGYFEIAYAADTPVNLLQNGANALRFIFDSAASEATLRARLDVYSGGDRVGYSWDPFWANTLNDKEQGFAVDVPFSTFDGLDLTQVNRISFQASRILPEANFRLTSISTVPEPSTMSLGLVFGLSLYLYKRHRTKASSSLTRKLVNC